MRLLAATIGALLISVSQPALAQEHDGGLPQGEWQQSEHRQDEPQGMDPQPQSGSQPELHQPEIPQPVTEQAGMQPQATPQPTTEQAEMQQPEMQLPAGPEPATQQVETQRTVPQPPAERPDVPPPPEMQRAETQQPAPQQAEMPRPAMPEPQAQQTEPPQQAAMPEPQADTEDVALPRDAKWTVFLEPSLGTRMDLPSAVFSMSDGPAYRGVGRQYKTADGRAAVAVYSQRNNQRDTPARYLRKNFVFPRAAVAYERITRDFFAVSGVTDGMIFYSRCNVSPAGGTLHCFDVRYPAGEKTAWDAIVTRMSRSLRPLNRS